MFATSLLVLAFAATGFAQAPEGYKTVYITSMVDSKFVVVPKTATSGSTLVVFVTQASENAGNIYLTYFFPYL